MECIHTVGALPVHYRSTYAPCEHAAYPSEQTPQGSSTATTASAAHSAASSATAIAATPTKAPLRQGVPHRREPRHALPSLTAPHLPLLR